MPEPRMRRTLPFWPPKRKSNVQMCNDGDCPDWEFPHDEHGRNQPMTATPHTGHDPDENGRRDT